MSGYFAMCVSEEAGWLELLGWEVWERAGIANPPTAAPSAQPIAKHAILPAALIASIVLTCQPRVWTRTQRGGSRNVRAAIVAKRPHE